MPRIANQWNEQELRGDGKAMQCEDVQWKRTARRIKGMAEIGGALPWKRTAKNCLGKEKLKEQWMSVEKQWISNALNRMETNSKAKDKHRAEQHRRGIDGSGKSLKRKREVS